ncbi:hypothetical protein LTR97_012269 [Elasticomyces elasticus]|uniref:FAD-binding domain-containing protein n=1 Tax=Elasticomyces elasticus TaxID=574655 RepID=A0AAN7VR48_9PEZI|nr:hypothetical protein LTR97_012269 [Elasticomyces elasticus]
MGYQKHNPLKLIVVGAGIGGLACAIACRQRNIEVVMLERAPEFRPVGAGIQLPANATRAMRELGLYERLKDYGAVTVQNHVMRAYNTGRVLASKTAGPVTAELYGTEWMVIHRARYHSLLLEEAIRLGVEVRLGCEVAEVKVKASVTVLTLQDGSTVSGDVVIGADGLWSQMRRSGLHDCTVPSETGDLAYRGTFSAEQLRDMRDAGVEELLQASDVQVWLGPEKHVVFCPVNNNTQYNLVLLRPDDLPKDARTELGSLDEMRETFKDWDPRLTRMIAQLQTALKWKLCHCEELETWVNGSVALLGDACHPTLPYQAQGAAMAVEDGLTLGVLLGRLNECSDMMHDCILREALEGVLTLYEKLRKLRTTVSVKGAVSMQNFFHLADGDAQTYRDQILHDYDLTGAWPADCKWNWGDAVYQRSLLGVDVVKDANEAFDLWTKERGRQQDQQ